MRSDSGTPPTPSEGRGGQGKKPAVCWHAFPDATALVERVAEIIAQRLAGALRRRGAARLILSGGTTPQPLHAALARRPLPWEGVTVLPTDERWVPEDDPRSNMGAIRRAFAGTPAARARLVPLYLPGCASPAAALAAGHGARAELDEPADVLVLGMGTDGHVASLFPGIDPAMASRPLVAAPPAPLPGPDSPPRLSLGLDVLTAAAVPVLFIRGRDKRRVLEEALASASAADGGPALPVALFARRLRRPLAVCWAP
ncbi:MAG: 6-phosphogluconolactonase [Rhodothalassiaceae bacterium]|nr:MAG: 6-phosphogluconolactonase [Rhodothalassiaceae bacterium]